TGQRRGGRNIVAMEPPEDKRGGKTKGLFNVSCLSTALFVVYVSYVAYNMHGVMNPMRNAVIDPEAPTIKPLWSEGTKASNQESMAATCYLTTSRTFHASFLDRSSPSAARAPLVGRAEGLTFDQNMSRHSFDLNLTAPSAGADLTLPYTTILDDRDWGALMSNKTMYFHVLLQAETPPQAGEESQQQEDTGLWHLLGSVPLVKYGPKPKIRTTRKLLSDFGIGGGGGGGGSSSGASADSKGAGKIDGGGGGGGGYSSSSSGSRATSRKGGYISFWKPEVAVRVVADFTEYPHNYLPQTIQRAAEIVGLTKDGRWATGEAWDSLAYKPIVHVDEIGLTSDKYVPLNTTLSSLPLKVTIEPMSLQRWQLMQSMEHSLQQQKESFGFQDSDVDDLRRLISDTNVYLLIVTLLASALHLLFEFLAFKSDVDFWRRNKSLRGLSVRTLFMEVFFQTIILLSLVEEDSSLLVTVPAGVGVLIQIWKVRRATGMQISGSSSVAGGGGEGSGADQAMETMRYDRMAIAYLSLLLLPLVVGYSAKKLVMDEHAGWYSLALQSVT
ncbi:unnamed protein product, partial [Scytosiphon promiscuus]